MGEISQKQSDKRGVDRDSIEPSVIISVVFQSGQCPPDLKQDFLIQVVPVGGVPRINTADFQVFGPFSRTIPETSRHLSNQNSICLYLISRREKKKLTEKFVFSKVVARGDPDHRSPATLATLATFNPGLDDDGAVRRVQTGNWKQTSFANRCSAMM
jgi:hypothetical protein